MTSARVVRGVIVVAFALALAGGAALANLRLIEAHDRRVEPLSLPHASWPSPPDTSTDPGGGPTPTTSTTTPPSSVLGTTTVPTPSTLPGDAPPRTVSGGSTTSHAVGAAGTVVVSVQAGAVRLVSVRPTSGWTYIVEKQSGDEVEIKFRRIADGAEASFHARLDGGGLRVEIDDDDIEGPDD